MSWSNAAFDLASQREDEERMAMIASASTALNQTGRDECVECGHTIPEARRLIMPSAIRCVGCQSADEGK